METDTLEAFIVKVAPNMLSLARQVSVGPPVTIFDSMDANASTRDKDNWG